MKEQDGLEKPSRRQLIVDIAHVLTAVAAVAAVVFTVVYTSEANDTSAQSLVVAQDAQEQAESAAEKALALKFYIGGIPPGESLGEDVSELAVINASAVDMYDVTVFGSVPVFYDPPDGDHPVFPFAEPEFIEGSIELEPFHACTGYTLPADFNVEKVHFFDGSTHWVRHSDGRLGKPSDSSGSGGSGGSSGRTFSSDSKVSSADPQISVLPLDEREPYKATTESRAFDVRSCS